jgi:aspartate-semialdehyde dehydrogenase
MSAGGTVAKEWAARIGAKNCLVIDNSSAFRYDSDVPLVVPEVNAHVLKDYMAKKNRRNIIANPNCSTAQLVVALKPLHDAAKILRVVVSTYQSVSGAGKEGIDELDHQTKGLYGLKESAPKKFTKRIAFNVIPHIDVFMEDGYTKEEWKMMVETKKILDPKIKLTATCVRVPVFIAHSEAVNVEFERPISPEEAREILRKAPGIVVDDKRENGGYTTPMEAAGEDATYISRIREDATVENGLAFWCVSDNLRKGAALNAVQIAECLMNHKLITPKAK